VRNNKSNITVKNCLVSEECSDGIEYGTVHGASGRNSIVSTSIWSEEGFSSIKKVESVTIDTEIAVEDEVIGMKVDVEGHEINVLRGASNLLSKNKVLIQIESYSAEHTKELTSYLTSLNYRLMSVIGPDHYFTNITHLQGSEA